LVQLKFFEVSMSKLPPLNSLKAFEAAQRHMSFQKAAEELFVTPAALSYQIRQLEEHLDTRLFHRLNRAVELTPEGKVIATGVEDSFNLLKQTMTRLQRRKDASVLVISAGPAFTSKWLAPRLYRFLARWPDIDVRISASLKKADLTIGDVDVGLRFGSGNYEGCTSVKLLEECVTPMCSPSLVSGSTPISEPVDLAKHTLIHDDTHINSGMFSLPDWKQWLEKAGVAGVVDAEKGTHFDIADHSLDAAIAGAGVVLGRTVLADGDIKAGRLVTPFDLRLKAEYAFYVVFAETRTNEKNIKRFTDWVSEEARGIVDANVLAPAV